MILGKYTDQAMRDADRLEIQQHFAHRVTRYVEQRIDFSPHLEARVRDLGTIVGMACDQMAVTISADLVGTNDVEIKREARDAIDFAVPVPASVWQHVKQSFAQWLAPSPVADAGKIRQWIEEQRAQVAARIMVRYDVRRYSAPRVEAVNETIPTFMCPHITAEHGPHHRFLISGPDAADAVAMELIDRLFGFAERNAMPALDGQEIADFRSEIVLLKNKLGDHS